MPRYVRRVLAVDDDGRIAVEGRLVAVLDSPKAGRNTITAIIEIEDEPPATFEDDEPTTSYQDAADPTCAGKDGECSRSVDEPGDYCWQHGAE